MLPFLTDAPIYGFCLFKKKNQVVADGTIIGLCSLYLGVSDASNGEKPTIANGIGFT
jgi:hypothetical protein